MLTIAVEPHAEEEWLGENPSPALFPPGSQRHPLYHQWLTCHADKPLIINAYATGTGKTQAALLRLLQRYRDKGSLESSEDNVLLIAPTNELLAQHARDVKDFCQINQLPYRVLLMSRASLDEIAQQPGFSEGKLRPGAALHAIMEDPRRADHDRSRQATIFVVNPDIFYYAFYLRYNRYDRIPLFQDIFTSCNYIIIDEFHYYNPKQLANFLFFMHLSRHFGFVDGSTKRQFCLLTATPSSEVDAYLSRLSYPMDRIVPHQVPPGPAGLTRKVRALSPVYLEIYHTDELRRGNQEDLTGLLALVAQKRRELTTWLRNGEDGAIISSSLWRIEQIYKLLLPHLTERLMGRITGPEKRTGREQSSRKPLILATPTVDIGYNFNRSQKMRQAIDFLFFDARSSDEFLQRLGRAGRVLGKNEQNRPSRVYVVVDPTFYQALQPFDGQTLSRTDLRRLAEEVLPPRNDLYAYIASGALGEAFLPIYQLKTMEASAREAEIEALFNSVHALFQGKPTITYPQLRSEIRTFLRQEHQYRGLETLSPLQLSTLERVIIRREPHEAPWLEGVAGRLQEEQDRRKRTQKPSWTGREAYEWAISDLRQYMVGKARFSFREDFQPPQALICDPARLHSSETVTCDDALRIVRYYHATYFRSCGEWEQQMCQKAPDDAKDALVFCHLRALRAPDAQLRVGFTLDAGDYEQVAWEHTFTNQMTTLYGLELVALNDHTGLPPDIQFLFKERFVPAFIVAQQSKRASALWQLQKRAQFLPSPLHVTFGDDGTAEYWAIFGTMALLISATL